MHTTVASSSQGAARFSPPPHPAFSGSRRLSPLTQLSFTETTASVGEFARQGSMVVKRGGRCAHRAPRGKRAWAGAGRDIGPQEGGRRDGGDVRAKGKGGGVSHQNARWRSPNERESLISGCEYLSMIFFATSRRPCPDKNVPLPRGNEAAGRNRGGSGAVRGGDPSVPDLPSGRGRRRLHPPAPPPVLHVRIGVGREDWVGKGGRPVTHMSCWHLGAPLGVVQVARIPAPPFDERRADLADLADLARHRASPHGTALLSPLGSPRRPPKCSCSP